MTTTWTGTPTVSVLRQSMSCGTQSMLPSKLPKPTGLDWTDHLCQARTRV